MSCQCRNVELMIPSFFFTAAGFRVVLPKQANHAATQTGTAAAMSSIECCFTKTVETHISTLNAISAAFRQGAAKPFVVIRAKVAAQAPRTCMEGETLVLVSSI